VRFAVTPKIFGCHGLDAFEGSCDRATKGVAFPVGLLQEFLDVGGGLISIHEDLFGDDAPLAIDLPFREERVHVNVAENIADAWKILGCSRGVVAGAFLGGKSIHVAANALDILHNAASGALRRSFEKHVLDKV
jgi:hypothetical protein